MRKILWMTLLAVFLLHLQGCTVRTKYLIVNNTGRSLALLPKHRSYPLDDQQAAVYFSRGKNLQTIKDQSSRWVPSGGRRMFDFVQDGTVFGYGANSVRHPRGYGKWMGHWFTLWEPYGFVVQVEPDGLIHVLEHDQSVPAQSFPPQPEGYPLVPSKTVLKP